MTRSRTAAAALATITYLGAAALVAALLAPAATAQTRAGRPAATPDTLRCLSSGDPAGPVDMSCDTSTLGQDYLPDYDATIAVNPYFPDHIVAGSTDYFPKPAGAYGNNTRLSHFSSLDGGRHWLDGPIPLPAGKVSAYPTAAFSRKHSDRRNPLASTVLMGGRVADLNPTGPQADVSVSRSTNGGLTFAEPVTVFGDGVRSYDKPWLTVDNNPASPHYGRAYLAASGFLIGERGALEFPVFFSWSDDGGRSWAEPTTISGSHPSCTYQRSGGGTDCDESRFALPEVAPDGTLYVHFGNLQNESAWEFPSEFDTQLMVVRSDDGGRTFGGPTQAAQLENGVSDGPASFFLYGPQRGTIYGHQFDVNNFGTIAVDPSDGELVVVFADRGTPNPNGTAGCGLAAQPPDYDPCGSGPGSDTDVYMVRSTDRGATWSERRLVDDGGGRSQWFPAADFTSTGKLVVAWNEDTRAAPADTYVHVLLEDGRRQVVSGVEHPDEAAVNWVGQVVTDRDRWPLICGPAVPSTPGSEPGKDCSMSIGNYTALTVDSRDRVHVAWTGMNTLVTTPEIDPYTGQPHSGYRQDSMYTRR